MDVTSREKDIIDLIIKTSGRHTAVSIATYLNVSTRTVQRDLKSIERILESFDLHLARNTNKGLMIEGKNEQIFRLIQHLVGVNPVDQPTQEKKLLLLLALLHEESYKIQALAAHLGVSITTLTIYLDELTDWLKNLDVQVSRKRGVGVVLIGTESIKRQALARYILQYFDEELIESLFLLERENSAQGKVLHYFSPNYLVAIDKVINAEFLQPRLAYSDYIGLIVHICITIQRTEAGFLLGDMEETDELEHEYELIENICTVLEQTCSISLAKSDLIYLAVILKGAKLQAVNDLPYDRVVISNKIKNLIQYVSAQLHIDLTNDFSLYQGLMAHMGPSLFRIKQNMGLFNPLKEEIKRKYPLLFLAVKNYAEREFNEIDDFPDDEIAFIVLHFGSALVMREEEISIKALVLCPTGIGTSKMLASRLKKEIIEIDSVEIKSIKDILEQKKLKNYDVIISTVRLPFMDIDYILVSPLLNEENILAIKSYIENNIENITRNKQAILSARKEAPEFILDKGALANILQEMKDVYESINSVMKNFRVYRMSHNKYEKILEEMVSFAEKDKLLSHVDDVIESLQSRERKGGLGIPNTGMALFHCKDENVKELIFQIAHLEEPCLVKGMDGKDMLMKSLLLMLAPEELSISQQEIVSLISTGLIESNETIMIYLSANEELILTRLEAVFLDYLHTNLIKD